LPCFGQPDEIRDLVLADEPMHIGELELGVVV
jgi:hypothetical protein